MKEKLLKKIKSRELTGWCHCLGYIGFTFGGRKCQGRV